MATVKLTEKGIQALSLPDKPKQVDHFDTQTRGLSVRVSYTGLKVYQLHSKNKRVKLGLVGEVSLKEARRRAVIAKAELAKERPSTKVVRGSFGRLVQKYIEHARQYQWTSPLSERSAMSCINRVILPKFGHLPPSKVTRDSIKQVLGELSDRPAAADQFKVYIQAIFRFCVNEEHLERNPAAGLKSHYSNDGPKRFLSEKEIQKVLIAARQLKPVPRLAVRFLFLTAQRRLIIERATWSGVNKDRKTLRFRSKGKRTQGINWFEMPLSNDAFKIILALEKYRTDERLFPSSRGSKIHLDNVIRQLRTLSGVDDWSAHDIKHTIGDAMRNKLEGIAPAVRYGCLDQKIGDLEMYADQESESALKLMRDAYEQVARWLRFIEHGPVITPSFEEWAIGVEGTKDDQRPLQSDEEIASSMPRKRPR